MLRVAYQNGQIRCMLVACKWLFKTGKIIQEHLNLERVRSGSAIAGSIKLALFDFLLWWQGVQNWNHHSWTSQLGKDEVRKRNKWHLILIFIDNHRFWWVEKRNWILMTMQTMWNKKSIFPSPPSQTIVCIPGCSTKQQTVLFHRCAKTVVLLWDWFEMWESIN